MAQLPVSTSRAEIRRKTLAWVVLLLVAFTLVRVPRWSVTLMGEEGEFALLAVERPPGPDYDLVARIDGENVFQPMYHPAAMYEFLRGAGWLWFSLGADSDAPEAQMNRSLRILFSTFQLLFWLALLIVLRRSASAEQRRQGPVLLVAAAISPIAVTVSTRLQIDGSIGAWMNGGVALALVWAAGRPPSVPRLPLALGAAFLGLGKQEWSVALVAAIIVWWGYLRLRRDATENLRPWRLVAMLLLGGLAVGNLGSYVLDPVNYVGGLRIIGEMVGSNTPLGGGGSWTLAGWWTVTVARLPMLSSVIVIAMVAALAVAAGRRRPPPLKALLILHGLALLLVFALSSYHTQVRYFAPALVVLTAACISVLDQPSRGTAGKVRCVLVLGLLVYGTVYAAAKLPGHRTRVDEGPPVLELPPMQDDELPRMPSADAWRRHDTDYVGRSMGVPWAEEFAGKHGRRLGQPIRRSAWHPHPPSGD